ncbi:helix-turn-helix transcriptional regulator [Leptolyngbya sp. 7M]|uniref:helix-turn-helix transcriptional regulator n=1 Tax=Leptolyngbya sp. 7M TaxID=2812896 RepID=UPI001B8AF694|nr:helix-turn-helix transcriptional regulator [Leptolyngbya sp. 7M]QYO67120.1 helix-turn-helix transcriptional regulator [Leptolyngbya sp. 7M]
MQHLSQDDFQQFSECLHELYQICSISDFPSRLLSITSKMIAAIDYTYNVLSFKMHRSDTVNYQAAPGFDPMDIADFDQIAYQHFYEHPLVGNYLRTRDGRAYKVSDFLNERQLHRLEGLYGRLMQPRGIKDLIAIALPITFADKPQRYGQEDIVAVTLMGDQIYTERDRFIFNLLRPHVLQAQNNLQQYTQIHQGWMQQRHTLDTLGVIALNSDGRVQFVSQQAGRWLKQYFSDLIGAVHYLPDYLQRWVNYQLSLTRQTDEVPSPHLPLKLEQDGKQLVVRFVIEQPRERYLLLLEERQLLNLSAASLELLGLTRREAEVLFEVTRGKTNAEIAVILDLSVATVRKYLENIYSKLAVKTRAEAVVYALKQLGAIG